MLKLQLISEDDKYGKIMWHTLIIFSSFPSQVIDNYMLEQARKDELSVETFSRMVQAVPNDSRENHDLIFEVLESLLKSGTGYSFFWFIIETLTLEWNVCS